MALLTRVRSAASINKVCHRSAGSAFGQNRSAADGSIRARGFPDLGLYDRPVTAHTAAVNATPNPAHPWAAKSADGTATFADAEDRSGRNRTLRVDRHQRRGQIRPSVGTVMTNGSPIVVPTGEPE